MIFASTSGNTEAVFDKIASLLTTAHLPHILSRSEETPTSVIDQYQAFVLGTSTWEHGRINPKFDTLLEYIRTHSMAGKKAAFVGLGDQRYEPVAFNAGMTLLRDTFLHSGGTEIAHPLIIDGDPFPLLDTKVPFWVEILVTQLSND